LFIFKYLFSLTLFKVVKTFYLVTV
jgi:hypothetical protein